MLKRFNLYLTAIIAISLFPQLVLAEETLDQQLTSWTVTAVWATAIFVAILVLVAITMPQMAEHHKTELFWGISSPVILVSLFVAASTIYLNVISETKGPVHWHADFRIFNCGQEIDLADPVGLSNKIGTPLFHEHDDLRVHVEGTVHRIENVSLGSFFRTIGGEASMGELVLPTTQGSLSMRKGDLCQGGDSRYENRPAQMHVYLYKTEGTKVTQEKLGNWPDYILSPETIVPPGDCVIFEFSPDIKGQTDKICDFYAIELQKGNLTAENFEYGN